MAVFAKAKIGKIKKATGMCKKCCKIIDGDFFLPVPNGMANANKMPVIVANSRIQHKIPHKNATNQIRNKVVNFQPV